MAEIKWSQFFVVGIIALVLGGVLGVMAFQKEVQIDGTGINQTECQEVNQTECKACTECEINEKTAKQIIASKEGYLLDELFLETSFNEILSDRELNLFDDEIEFDGEDYDAEETFTLTNLMLKANEKDFEGNVYLIVLEGAITYSFDFESSLDTSKINEDETLELNLLGEDVEISKWDVDEITFSMGTNYYLKQEESVEVDGKTITLDLVYDEKVFVSVNNETKRILTGETARFEDLEVFVKEVDYQAYAEGYKQATLVIGKDVTKTVKNEDEYEKDSIWKWIIDEHSIGITLTEEFVEIDEELYNALSSEEKICLPNDYVCIRYNGLIGEDMEEYTFELYEKNSLNYIRVDGNFLSGINDYDKIYLNASGIYDRDFDEINNASIELGDTETILEISNDWIIINKINLTYDLSDIWVDNSNKSSNDEDYLTNYGILIEDPEKSVEDKYFTITIPEEQLEGILTVKMGGFEEITKDDTEEESEE